MLIFLFYIFSQILFDFTLLFTDTDANGLLGENWSKIRNVPFEKLNSRVNTQFPINDDEFMNFVYLLKVMLAHRQSFSNSIATFIKFETVSDRNNSDCLWCEFIECFSLTIQSPNGDVLNLLDHKNPHPVILTKVVHVDDRTDIKYFVGVEGRIISVSAYDSWNVNYYYIFLSHSRYRKNTVSFGLWIYFSKSIKCSTSDSISAWLR